MNILSAHICARFALSAWMFFACSSYAATDIANAPLSLSSTEIVKPNVMFILDDSGSMDETYSPDTANFGSDKLGAKSSHCNGMYFNPLVTYKPPVDSLGASYADSIFGEAQSNGYVTSRNTTNLNNSVYYVYKGSHPLHLDFKYKTNGSVDDTTAFYTECNTNASNNPVNFTKYTVTTSSSAALQTNFANWYSYYRTRMLTMKTAAGLAFKSIGPTYRVGYSTIGYSGTDSGNNDFLNLGDFDPTQKEKFYTKLYQASPTHWTPLRAALSKAGRLYAGQLLTGENDPVQYSCQQNFTILSTDGYWNTNEESGSYGPKAINGSTNVGNQDGAESRPMHDGTSVADVTTTTAKITVTGSNPSRTSVDRVVVNGQTITSGATTSDRNATNINTVASRLAGKIDRNGYTATAVDNVVTIKAPTSAGSITFTPVVTIASGNMTFTVTAFSSVTTPVTSGGVSNSLADVAAYYYNTDLRTTALGNCSGSKTGVDLCKNDVLGSGVDDKTSQHMTTFTLGLGVNGRLAYTEDYLSGTSVDFQAIKNGTKAWPDPIANAGPERIDDLWHAAVNGRGTYFSAQTPDSLVTGIVKALTGAKVRDGSGAAAATSNLEPVAADNFLFLATFRTTHWDGDLKAKTIDPNTGALSAAVSWSAQQKLDAKVSADSDTRTIYTYDGSATAAGSKLKLFAWDQLTDEKAYFNGICASTQPLTQCVDTVLGPNLSDTQKTNISGENLLKFIRGQTGLENRTTNVLVNRLYREREHVLGDMIGSQPVYVRAPPFAYVDDGYDDFKFAQKDRLAMVYVAANDGMLHAFEATIGAGTSGTEKWAYIPPMVLPNLYKLADRNYATNHQYYVDGTPTLGDVCPSAPAATCSGSEWKSILVGGLNSGGQGYYALDVTNPGSPKALWNFTVANDTGMGLSYGNPIITKLPGGQWVAAFTSGYNNDGGKGHLYVLNAYTGALIAKLDTTAGSTDTPSGLAKINAWIDSTTDNTAKRFYGGDLLGNLWRFEIDDRTGGIGRRVTALAELGNVSPVGLQPISIKPELSEITERGVNYAVVSIGTGRYLGESDLDNNDIQSVYTIKDDLSTTGLGKVRTAGVLVKQELIAGNNGSTRTTSTNSVSWADKAGWYLDLDLSVNAKGERLGERVNVDMQNQLGLLTFAGNVPEANACTPGGYAWVYSLDYRTGQFVAGSVNNVAGRRLDGLVAGLKTLKLTTGKTITLVTDTGGTINVLDDPTSNPGTGLGARRVSWRELIAD